jgi:ABC-type Fe3+-hydroxamate transport system substrate-binding protein
MVAGNTTFIDDMLSRCGFQNVFANSEARYPEVTPEQIKEMAPDIILLSSEPFPFKDTHVKEFKTLYPMAKVKVVDGELFSWYGSRLLKSPTYFEQLVQKIVK